MYICPTSVNSVSMQAGSNLGISAVNGLWTKVKQAVLDVFPEKTVQFKNMDANKLESIDKFLSKPAENRFVIGATALVTQPAIDYYNHKVDEDTRVVSRNRTIAKIIAGTGVGIIVRGLCYLLVENKTKISPNSKSSRWLLPEKFLKSIVAEPNFLKNYRSALSTFLALCAMCITNFVLDAPLTVYFTNKLNQKTLKNKTDDNDFSHKGVNYGANYGVNCGVNDGAGAKDVKSVNVPGSLKEGVYV